MNTQLKEMLVKRRFLVADAKLDIDKTKQAYMNSYLLCNFGIVVDKPKQLTKEMVENISTLYRLNVPASFYSNPQDMNFFTKEELLIEQLVSYYLVESGSGVYTRPEIFKKDLPEYVQGDELKLREFTVLTEKEAEDKLREIADAYCDYTRPFGLDEVAEFEALFAANLVDTNRELKCKDNILILLEKDVAFAKFLDKKDLVKLSVKFVGEKKDVKTAFKSLNTKQAVILGRALPLVKNCPLTKKQAKYFNTLVKNFGTGDVKQVYANSPYKTAMPLVKEGKIVEAAKVFAKNGSMLQRNLKMLLSRANPEEAVEIVNMLPAKNPIVLLQLVNTLKADNGSARTFVFHTNNLVKRHVETDYETKWRKSRLSEGTIKYLHKACVNKVFDYYDSLPKLGKIYINPAFYRIGLPTNTSAGGKGIDALPTGSRLLITSKFIRTFVSWKGVYDIDASLTAIGVNGEFRTMDFRNYGNKPLGQGALFSGDNRDRNGTEYYDLDLEELKKFGVKYLIQSFHGYNGRLNEGEIFCGFQLKDNLNTKAWDPKNIEVQFNVKGDTRACTAFAIDVDTNEMIMLNLMVEDESRVLNRTEEESVMKYLNADFLELNIGNVVEKRGTLVETPEEADVIFDNDYAPTKEQKVVRTYDLEKLVSLANGN